ncbi:MAG: hypothetical protein RIT02_1858 [Planctomycetota bacterium]|jgi:hypothetical protein
MFFPTLAVIFDFYRKCHKILRRIHQPALISKQNGQKMHF